MRATNAVAVEDAMMVVETGKFYTDLRYMSRR